MGNLPPELLLPPQNSFRCSTPVGENLYNLGGLVMRSAVICRQGERSAGETLPDNAIGLLVGLSDVDWQGDRWPVFLVCLPTGGSVVGRVWSTVTEAPERTILIASEGRVLP